MRIAIGMSGGVDSSVAALLLKNEGHDVHGITMKLWDDSLAHPSTSSTEKHACYGPGEAKEIQQAADVCVALGIPHSVYDLSREYRSSVINYFTSEYKRGRTPNPCVRCNLEMKFNLLPSIAQQELGVDRYATGHYVIRHRNKVTGACFLKKGYDRARDQSYFLYRLTQRELARSLFPLGRLTKNEVREIAREHLLPVKDEPDSQDFYEGDYRELIGDCGMPGVFIDIHGRVLGKHRGIANYTVGQRRGIGISAAEPLYVQRIDAEKNMIVLGRKDDIAVPSFRIHDLCWSSGSCCDATGEISVKTRSAQPPVSCTIKPFSRKEVQVTLTDSVTIPAPGQSAVFYRGDVLIGGGVIS